ncbi:MAG: 50S ribosomal protein L38e [Candidatus Njordarchaeales archaeon]
MPREIHKLEQLDEIIPRTLEVRVKKHKDFVKVKFRTKSYLYTIKLSEREAEALLEKIKELNIPIKYF